MDAARPAKSSVPAELQEFLAGGRVDAAVFALRPDYRALLLAVDGLVPGPGDQASDGTTTALFILDALAPATDEALHAAADDLAAHLGPDVLTARRLIASNPQSNPFC